MESLHDPLARIAVLLLAAGVVVVLGLLSVQSKADDRGWRLIKASATHWTGVILGSSLTGLFVYVWLFVGSSRADADHQMAVLFWLIIAFGVGTIIVGLTIRAITKRAVRWRGQSIVFATAGRAQRRDFNDIFDMRSRLWGSVDLRFRDGASLWLDPHAKGAPELIEAISNHLEKEAG